MTTFPTADRTTDDAAAFVDCVDRVVAGLVFRYRPQVVCVVRIRKWFDHRWLHFSGKDLVPFWGRELTFPPFTPNRVEDERHWERRDNGSYARAEPRFRVHSTERQPSRTNIRRRIAELTDSALFVWFSSTSAKDGRASLLVYIVNDGTTIPWFAEMCGDASAWKLGEVKGLGRAEVEELLQHPPGVRA